MNQLNDLGLTDVRATGATGTCGCGGAAGACQCGGHANQNGHAHGGAHGTAQASDVAPTDDVVRAHYLVEGMTCAHCVSSVTEEVGAIDGVSSVSVDLNAGGTSRIMVTSPQPIPVEGVRTAIEEAGYTLVDSRS